MQTQEHGFMGFITFFQIQVAGNPKNPFTSPWPSGRAIPVKNVEYSSFGVLKQVMW
jgi:hypothetical protein